MFVKLSFNGVSAFVAIDKIVSITTKVNPTVTHVRTLINEKSWYDDRTAEELILHIESLSA